MHAHKKGQLICSEEGTHLLLNIMKDLDINRFLDMCKKVFQEGGRTETVSVCTTAAHFIHFY